MFSPTLAVLMGYMAVVSSREAVRPMPTITNSLVNLGKMEVSFYFSGNGRDGPSHAMKPDHGSSFPPQFSPKVETIYEEPCPCSSMRNAKDNFMSNPTGLINKILLNHDLFANPNDPVRSTMCCDSHEHVQEGAVYFEFTPEQSIKPIKPIKPSAARSNPLPMLPFLFDSMIPNKSKLPTITKSQAIEVLLFPKKKDLATVASSHDLPKFKFESKKKNTLPKKDREITIVGEKKLENNINLFKPPPPVKKDLSAQIKKERENENAKPAEEGETIMVEPAGKPNAV